MCLAMERCVDVPVLMALILCFDVPLQVPAIVPDRKTLRI